MTYSTPDLTQHPPRSPRVRLGGYVSLARCFDKGRATVAGKNGEYNFACPLDMRVLDFVGVEPESLKQEIAAGKSDSELLEWIEKNARFRRSPIEIAAFSTFLEQRGPGDPETREYVNSVQSKIAPHREDIFSFFDLLDLDDYASFGGKP